MSFMEFGGNSDVLELLCAMVLYDFHDQLLKLMLVW